MRTAFIIAEYHPFHSGHSAMAQQLHRMGFDAVAAVMSGNFVQRGTPALLPKQVRAAAALRGGVDLVLELPCRAAASGAERFAFAGVAAAAASGCADVLAFGAETPDAERLTAAAKALLRPELAPLLQQKLQAGLPFYAARSAAAEALCPGAGELLSAPNNNLAVEYLKALELLHRAGVRTPEPLPLPRIGARHDGAPSGGIASASHLRSLPVSQWAPFVPAPAQKLYLEAEAAGNLLDPARWECAALTLLRTRTPQQLAALPDVSEGLDALLCRAIHSCTDLETLYAAVKSKRYTHARIRRLVLAAALGWRKPAPVPSVFGPDIPYLRPLGATQAGLALLSAVSARAALPVSASLAELERLGGACAEAAQAEAAAGDLYALVLRRPAPCGGEYRGFFEKAGVPADMTIL